MGQGARAHRRGSRFGALHRKQRHHHEGSELRLTAEQHDLVLTARLELRGLAFAHLLAGGLDPDMLALRCAGGSYTWASLAQVVLGSDRARMVVMDMDGASFWEPPKLRTGPSEVPGLPPAVYK